MLKKKLPKFIKNRIFAINYLTMGKGDKKSFRGKLFMGSFGKSRPKSNSSNKSPKK